MSDEETVPSSWPVSIMLQRDSRTDPWGKPRWQILGVTPESGPPPAQPTYILARDGEDARIDLWRGLSIWLNPDGCDDYRLNLTSRQPLLFVICQPDAAGNMRPVTISADQEDGVAAQEVEETVFETPMPRPIALWLEQYIQSHGRPGPRKNARW